MSNNTSKKKRIYFNLKHATVTCNNKNAKQLFLNPLFWENARNHLQHGPWEDLETDVQISSIPIFLPIKPISFADHTLKLIIAVVP
jgi:hypothetical protein